MKEAAAAASILILSSAALFPAPGSFTELVSPTAMQAAEVYLERNTTVPRLIFYVRSWLDRWMLMENGKTCRLPPSSIPLGRWEKEMTRFAGVKGILLRVNRAEARLSAYEVGRGGVSPSKIRLLMGEEGRPGRGAVKIDWAVSARFEHSGGMASAELDESGTAVYGIRIYELWDLALRGERLIRGAAGEVNRSRFTASSLEGALRLTERAMSSAVRAARSEARRLAGEAESEGLEVGWELEVAARSTEITRWECGGSVTRTWRIHATLIPMDPSGSFFKPDGSRHRGFRCTWEFSFSIESSARWVVEEDECGRRPGG